MRDDELPLLARIYNLHRRFREILVDGMLPEGDMGDNAAIRGDKKRRFLATGQRGVDGKENSSSLGREHRTRAL